MIAYRFLFFGAAMLGFAGLAHAQAVDPGRAAVERADAVVRSLQEAPITDPTVFVKSAALGGMTGMQLAKLAQSKSQDAGVRTFAARVLKDHEAIHQELVAIAQRKRLDVPDALDYEDEQLVMTAGEKSEIEFDEWYVRQMIAEYQDAVGLYQGAAKMDDAQFAAFAKKTLPTLDDQQRAALGLLNTLRAPP